MKDMIGGMSAKDFLEKMDKDRKKSPTTHKMMKAHNKILSDYSAASFKACSRMFDNANEPLIKQAKMLKKKLNTIERLEENWKDDLITEDFINKELNRLGYGDRRHSQSD